MTLFGVDHAELPIPVHIAWRCAGRHIHRMSDGAVAWLKMHADAPTHGHLIFRIGNRLFFAFIEVPGFTVFDDVAERRLQRAAQDANGIPCLMPMRSDPKGPDLVPAAPSWGLIDPRRERPVDPAALVNDELVVMSDWELLDFAVLVVRTHIDRGGGHVYLWQSSVGVDPAVWFRQGDAEQYAVVRSARHPDPDPLPPDNLAELKDEIRRNTNARGFFAPVRVANANDPFATAEAALPLYRGHALVVAYGGLIPI